MKMPLSISSRLKAFKTSLDTATESIPYSIIFGLDTLSFTLLAIAIFGMISHVPEMVYLTIQSTFIAITFFLTLFFFYRRIYYMAFLKLSMLILDYVLDSHIYYI